MYHPTTRVLTVLELLQAHRRLTGPELARRLEVNIRTLRRYITMLQDLGIPIVAERGRYGAYELSPGFKLPPMMFTNEEGLALAIGLLAARQLGLADTVHAVESARAKLEQVMPHELKSRVRALTETITLELPPTPAASLGEVLLLLSRAAQLFRQVHLRYRSSQSAVTERLFDPYGLTRYQNEWYVVGHCHLRQGLRSFRLDRVLQVELTDTRFERPDQFNVLGHISQSIATLPRAFSFEVWLKTDLDTSQRELRTVLGALEASEGGVLLRGSVDDLDWLARELARLPFPFVVRSPQALRAALRRRARDLEHLAKAH